jgi:CRP/FNR family transcriptional regulator
VSRADPAPTLPDVVAAILPQTFLGRVPPSLARELLAGGRGVDLAPGAPLRAPAGRRGVVIVVDGLARVFVASGTRQATVRYARAGETLGLVQLLGGALDVQAQAVTACSLWALPARRLRALANEHAPLAVAIAEECAARVADAVEELSLLTFGSVRQRVARHLLDLAAGETRGGELVARVTQQALADATGSVREVVARDLRGLEESGRIARSARGIVILDAAQLDADARG